MKNVTLQHVVSNSQGVLIDAVQAAEGVDAILVNPGGLTNTGIALRDAIEDTKALTAVVHVTNAARREVWRQDDVFASIAHIYVAGAGAYSYVLALDALCAPVDWLGSS
jgi:3-dehydroquinate dehydratase-2